MLVSRAAAGDRDAFDELARRYESKLYSMMLRMCGNTDDAFDLTQEIFLRVWKTLGSFRGDSAFSTWIYRVASNIATDHLRRRKREVSLNYADNEKELDIPDTRYDPVVIGERHELTRDIEAALAMLNLEHRRILTLREINGLSYTEIAEILDIEEGTVKSRIARARLKMREFLAGYGNNNNSGASK